MILYGRGGQREARGPTFSMARQTFWVKILACEKGWPPDRVGQHEALRPKMAREDFHWPAKFFVQKFWPTCEKGWPPLL